MNHTQGRLPRRAVDGVLLLDKPPGMSSNAALQAARRLLRAQKAGHTGTLDPMASGLMVLTFGEATKFSQLLLEADKAYDASVTLGRETDTGDAEGRVIAEHAVSLSEGMLARVAAGFIGVIEQVPPMYSALKHQGRPLYAYAREGIEIERQPRRVTIHQLELHDMRETRFGMRVVCSKGTYIRTLAIDIGRALGCGAHLSGLRRTAIGPFELADAWTLDALEALPEAERVQALQPADSLLCHLPAHLLGAEDAWAISHGQPVAQQTSAGLLRLYGPLGFIGLAEAVAGKGIVPRRLVSSQHRASAES